MPAADLKAKYGPNLNTRAAINRAIRAELVGGDQALDALNALDQLAVKFRDRRWASDSSDAEAALARVSALVARMRAEIRSRYAMPPED